MDQNYENWVNAMRKNEETVRIIEAKLAREEVEATSENE